VTRLAQDCFAHGGGRIAVGAALALLEARVAPVAGVETVPLARAVGRCLAEPLVSLRDVPAFDNAAVDGYAFAFGEPMRETGARLALAPGRAAAGHAFAGALPPGAAVRVLTGAVMPEGADTVALQEEVEVGGAAVAVPAGLQRGANRRLAGEDVRAGQVVLRPGVRLRPQEIGLAAELGHASLMVHEPLRVAVLSTGDELVEPGRELARGAVFDANRHILGALLRSVPAEVTDLGIVRDDPGEVRAALGRAAVGHHAILTTGGASRGDEDHVVRSVQALGRLDFWQIAMKPGRPLAFGRLGDAVFVGLPGNPVAAMVCFLLFARPVLLRLGGAGWRRPTAFPVAAAFALKKRPGRSEYLRATLTPDEAGLPRARRIEREGSGILTSMVEAEGLIELDDTVERVVPGDTVRFLSFAELGIPA
jgi:molybdopterin molybdotransferase